MHWRVMAPSSAPPSPFTQSTLLAHRMVPTMFRWVFAHRLILSEMVSEITLAEFPLSPTWVLIQSHLQWQPRSQSIKSKSDVPKSTDGRSYSDSSKTPQTFPTILQKSLNDSCAHLINGDKAFFVGKELIYLSAGLKPLQSFLYLIPLLICSTHLSPVPSVSSKPSIWILSSWSTQIQSTSINSPSSMILRKRD